jgi:hypothetical protein
VLSIEHGIVGTWNKPTIYIKTLPGGHVTREGLERMLALYGDNRLTLDTYLEKCTKVHIEASGRASGEVFEILERPEYKCMQLDLEPLINLRPSEQKNLHQLDHENKLHR